MALRWESCIYPPVPPSSCGHSLAYGNQRRLSSLLLCAAIAFLAQARRESMNRGERVKAGTCMLIPAAPSPTPDPGPFPHSEAGHDREPVTFYDGASRPLATEPAQRSSCAALVVHRMASLVARESLLSTTIVRRCLPAIELTCRSLDSAALSLRITLYDGSTVPLPVMHHARNCSRLLR